MGLRPLGTHRDWCSLHKAKPDGVPAQPGASGLELPSLTKRLHPIDNPCKGLVFPNAISLGTLTTLKGKVRAQRQVANTELKSIFGAFFWSDIALFWVFPY